MSSNEQHFVIESTQRFVPPHDSTSDILDSQHEVIVALQDFRSANIVAASRLLVSGATETSAVSSILPHTHHPDVAANRLKNARESARKRMVAERMSLILQRQA